MKKSCNKKSLFRTVIVNVIIAICIFSVFSICFFDDNSIVVSSTDYKAIYRGNENNKNVSLCINIYWGTEYVLDMLDILDKNEVKATFFVGGTWASKNVEVLKEIYDRGHEIANHGYYHKDHKVIDLARNIQEISYNHKLIKELIDYDMQLFMPPGIVI